MQWINSNGGPLICGERHVVAQWLGIYGLSASLPFRNDYERACSTRGYLELMACGEGSVLVLGDEPLQSSFFRNDRGELAIARCVYAEAAGDVQQILTRPCSMSALSHPVPFAVTGNELVLLDSAASGTEIVRCHSADVRVGRYQVTTEELKADRNFCFVVHRLVRSEA